MARAVDGVAGLWVIESDGKACGNAGLVVTSPDAVEIFYALLPAARGHGLATRAARLLAGWARTAGYQTVALATFPDNSASQNTAARAGFVRVGTADRVIKGTSRTLFTWELTAPAT